MKLFWRSVTFQMASSISKCSLAHLKQTAKYLNFTFCLSVNHLLKKNFVSYNSRLISSTLCSKWHLRPVCRIHRTLSDLKVRRENALLETDGFEEQQPCDVVQRKWNTEQKRVLDEAVSKDNPPTSAEWLELRETILGMTGFITEKNIDALVMAACIASRKLAVGTSYIKYLWAAGRSLNIATASGFLKLCSVCSEESVVDEDLVLSVYSGLCSSCPLMDAQTAQNAILALCLTHRWEEGLELLETVKITATPNMLVLNSMVKAAFSHNRPEVGWSLMDEILHLNRKLMPMAYLAWLDYCAGQDKDSGVKYLDQLLTYMALNDLRPTKDVASRLNDCFVDFSTPDTKWVGTFTSLIRKGKCKSCGNLLPPVSLTAEEFGKLREVFVEQVLIGRNVFLKTSPAEVEEFRRFLQSCRPYDVVVDGLNVAFSGVKSSHNPRILAGFVHAVVKHFVSQSKTVLVLGRKHMAKWPRDTMNYVYRNAQVFLAHNLSQDDPFLLYAAMHGGLGTGFVSRDLMRSHVFLLKDAALKSSFRRWQQQHQYQIMYIEKNGNVKMKHPVQFNPSVQQGDGGSWHIPFDEDFSAQSTQSLEPPTSWLCLRKITY
ncbi:mitochondrial ribonuclease P catalytic subunit isoform X6 [Bacillus rossius redtenbacheri]|uniref:mitochondrial ribonuclease P catalytic subunit isoform X6 n=1 Tax=Bacillus rossius redtenbacheri TaxID=93214 RepID=UPI002FDED8D2